MWYLEKFTEKMYFTEQSGAETLKCSGLCLPTRGTQPIYAKIEMNPIGFSVRAGCLFVRYIAAELSKSK